jgi:hypothetical protein
MTEFVWIAVASGDYGTDEVSAVFSREELIFPWVTAWFDRLRADAGEKPINEDDLWGTVDGYFMEYADEFMDERVRVSRMPVLNDFKG